MARGSCNEQPRRIRPAPLPPGSRPPPAGPDAHLAADYAAGPTRPHPPGRHRGLGRAHACAAGPLPRLPTEPPRPRALLPRPALPLPLPPLHESHQHRSSTRPARCCRLTMPTRGALYNAGAEATSQQTTCSLASPAGHSTPRRLPIGRGGALTVNPGGLCPHLRIRASRGLAESCRVRWSDDPVPSGRRPEPRGGEAYY